MTDAQRMIDAEVRDLVRQRGIDPAVERVEVRRLAEAVVAAYEQRSLVSALPPIVDGDAIVQDVTDAVAGFGPLQRYLDDPAVEEIWINEPSRVFVARDGRTELTATILTEAEVRDLVERMLRSSGRRLDLSSPFVDAMLPDGSRLHVAIPDVTREHWAVNVRKHVVRAVDLDDLVELGTLTVPGAGFLRASVAAGLNILVSGGTQAGKTTLLNCLLAAVPARERVITVEEVFELKAPLPDIVALQTRQVGLEGTGQITLRHLVTEALRMRPNRIVVGEVRREEALDLLIALNSGVPGMRNDYVVCLHDCSSLRADQRRQGRPRGRCPTSGDGVPCARRSDGSPRYGGVRRQRPQRQRVRQEASRRLPRPANSGEQRTHSNRPCLVS